MRHHRNITKRPIYRSKRFTSFCSRATHFQFRWPTTEKLAA